MRLTSDDSQGRLYLELVFLDGIDFLRSCMWLLNASQFWWMSLVPWDARKSEQKVRDFSFSMSQFALDQMGKVLDGFLLTCAQRAISARIMPWWSEMPGMVCILFTRLGLLMQNRSRIASFLVGWRWSWCSWFSEMVVIIRSHRVLLSESSFTLRVSHSMSLALKLPAAMTQALGFLVVIVCRSCRAAWSPSQDSWSLGGL